MIVGICGAAGAGKDTAAARLVSSHSYRQIAFADPLYEMIAAMTGMPAALLRDREFKELPLMAVGKSPRELLQSLGTEWGRAMVADDIWIRLALQRAGQRTVISDVRFDNEAAAIRATGGVVWRVVRPDVGCLDASTAQHSSERGISPELIDAQIVNDCSLAALAARVDAALLKATFAYN